MSKNKRFVGSLRDTFMARTNNLTLTESGCWEWGNEIHRDGYGVMRHRGTYYMAHRLAYRFWVGDFDASLVIRHTCDNPPCVNPKHLLPGTQADNVMDAVSRGRNRSRPRALTWDQACEIRDRYVPYKVSCAMLAKEYGVPAPVISGIVQGKTYKRDWK